MSRTSVSERCVGEVRGLDPIRRILSVIDLN